MEPEHDACSHDTAALCRTLWVEPEHNVCSGHDTVALCRTLWVEPEHDVCSHDLALWSSIGQVSK